MDLVSAGPSLVLIPAFEAFRDAFLPTDEDMWRGVFATGRSDVRRTLRRPSPSRRDDGAGTHGHVFDHP